MNILAFLLHHANKCTKLPEFYAIKDKILSKHGIFIGTDIQFIEGKKCYTCHGTGVYHSLYSNYSDTCDNCYGGWYKIPMWILLSRRQFGKYVFHKPEKREYCLKNPFVASKDTKFIEGYIDHHYAKYSFLAIYILFLLYDRKMFRKYYLQNVGVWWRTYWYYPSNWLHTITHLLRYRMKSYPMKMLMDNLVSRKERSLNDSPYYDNFEKDDSSMPF